MLDIPPWSMEPAEPKRLDPLDDEDDRELLPEVRELPRVGRLLRELRDELLERELREEEDRLERLLRDERLERLLEEEREEPLERDPLLLLDPPKLPIMPPSPPLPPPPPELSLS